MTITAPAVALAPASIEDATARVVTVAREHAGDVDAAARFPEEAVAELRSSGLFGLTVSAENGGMGATPAQFAVTMSAIAEACGSTAMIFLMHCCAAAVIEAVPGETWAETLRSMASGESLGTLAFSEKGSRSHFWAPVSTATPNGEQVTVAAEKSWVTSAGHAQVYVISSGSVTGAAGEVDLYVLSAQTPGFEMSGSFSGLGLRGNDSAPMAVASTVSEKARLGDAAAGFGLMMSAVLPWFCLGNAAVSVGLARSAARAATAHASAARLEHVGQSLSNLPTIRAQLSKMGIAVAMQTGYVKDVAERMTAPDDETLLHIIGVKASANEMALTVTEMAMRVCGGAAFSKHLPVERVFRDARAGAVMAPTADMIYELYGLAVTGQPLF